MDEVMIRKKRKNASGRVYAVDRVVPFEYWERNAENLQADGYRLLTEDDINADYISLPKARAKSQEE